MGSRVRRPWWSSPTPILALAWLACTDVAEGEGTPGARSPSFSELFDLEARIELEEPDSAPITAISSLDVDSAGQLLVPAPTAGEVRLYGPDGRLRSRLGRPGDGPGEFRRPSAAVFGPGGSVYVSDTGSPRITRFTPGLDFDTTFALSGAYFGGALDVVPGGIVVFAMRSGPGALLYDVYDGEGSLRRRFHPLHPLIRSTPGWLSAARGRMAAGAGQVFVAENLLYPIWRYPLHGHRADSIGTRPPSWRRASRPKPGSFQGVDAWSRFARWRRTFTSISALDVFRDSLLLVTHQALDPGVVAYEEASYRLDVYRLHRGTRKVCEDVGLPGPLLRSKDAVYLLLGGPPRLRAWTLGRYSLRGGVCR